MKLIRREGKELYAIESLTREEIAGIRAMIEGTALPERRMFNPLLRKIKEEGV